MPLALRIAAVLALALPAIAAPEDLRKAYPGTLTWSQQGLVPVCAADDVWELKAFEVGLGRDLAIACKRAHVALGVHAGNVLWALVVPDEPAQIRSIRPGDGEHARTIFLRFAPADVGSVFPAATVRDRGGAWLRADAQRIARGKVGWKWSTPAGNPTVVPAGVCLVDVDTVEGPRRFYCIDRNAGTLEYVADFEARAVPPSPPIERKDALAAFDEVWTAFDREYACFGLRPDLDWGRVGKAHRKEIERVETLHGAAMVIADLVAELENLHAWVKVGDDWMPGATRERPLNASFEGTRALASATQKDGDELTWGRTDDGIGYLGVHGLTDSQLVERVDAALEALAETWALIVDLRFNGGGDERLAQGIAGRFVDEERVYSTHRFRSGPAHDALGEVASRRIAPRGPWRYAAPVVVLTGRRTMSSAESFALMLAQCPQVTTLGDPTAGSSGNPRLIELECGIAVNLPRWLDMDPDGNPIEHVGVAPDVRVEHAPQDFGPDRDGVLQAALDRLRARPEAERAPARRAEDPPGAAGR